MRKQNVKVIEAFLEKRSAQSPKRNITGYNYIIYRGCSISTDGRKLYSYSTPIAEWRGDVVAIDSSKYSNTTTLQQNDLALMLKQNGVKTEPMYA